MKCQNCQNENSDQANFCKICGTKLEYLKLVEPADGVEKREFIEDGRVENLPLRENVQVHDSDQTMQAKLVNTQSVEVNTQLVEVNTQSTKVHMQPKDVNRQAIQPSKAYMQPKDVNPQPIEAYPQSTAMNSQSHGMHTQPETVMQNFGTNAQQVNTSNAYGNHGKGVHLFLLFMPPMVYFMWAFVFQSFVYAASESFVRDIWIAMYHALFPLVHVSLLFVVFRKNANFAYTWYGVYFITRLMLVLWDVDGSFTFTSIHLLAMDCYIMASEYAIAYWIKQQTKHNFSEKMQMQVAVVVLVLSYPVLHWAKNVADTGLYYVPFNKFTIIGLLFGLIWLNIFMKSVGYSNNIINNNSAISA